jgi:hypothetical protein
MAGFVFLARPLTAFIEANVKNIKIVSSADAAEQELFAATDDEFALFFRPGENFAFLDKVSRHVPKVQLYAALSRVLARPVVPAPGIVTHGVLFYEKDAGDAGLL